MGWGGACHSSTQVMRRDAARRLGHCRRTAARCLKACEVAVSGWRQWTRDTRRGDPTIAAVAAVAWWVRLARGTWTRVVAIGLTASAQTASHARGPQWDPASRMDYGPFPLESGPVRSRVEAAGPSRPTDPARAAREPRDGSARTDAPRQQSRWDQAISGYAPPPHIQELDVTEKEMRSPGYDTGSGA